MRRGGRPTRRGVAVLALLVAAMVLPFAWPYLESLIPARSQPSPKPLELMVKAAMHLNSSDTALLRAVEYGRAAQGLGDMALDAGAVASQLVAVASQQPPSRLGRTIGRAAEAYSHMARAASYLYNVSEVLADASPRLERALEDLQACRVDEALSRYEETSPSINASIRLLEEAYLELLSTDPRALLSENHTLVLRRAEQDVGGLLGALREINKLFTLAEANREAFKHMCRGSLSEDDRRALQGVLASLKPSQAGPYGYQEASIASMISSALGQGGQSGQGGQPGSQGGQGISQGQGAQQGSGGSQGQGGGAGYGAPSSDD